jgi:PAS domain S-box-containing protein
VSISKWWQRIRSLVDLGISGGEPADLVKPTRLCNMVALVGCAIMLSWVLAELGGHHVISDIWLELGLAVGFATCLILNALHRHRAARIALILVANSAVFLGAILYDRDSGGELPYVSIIALPFLLARRSEKWLVSTGAVTVALFALSETEVVNRLAGIERLPTPSWYFAANAASAFICAFLLPFFFYRSNQRAEADLERRGQEQLERLIHCSIIGVGRGKLGGPVLEANDALLDLLGYTRKQLRAGELHLEWLTPPEYFERTMHAMSMLADHGVSPVYEKEYIRKDGTRVPVLVGMASLDPSTGDTIGFVLDISAHKAAEQQRVLLEQSEEAIRTRDLFDSVVSHELRTPLATISLQVELALRALAKGDRHRGTVERHLVSCKVSTRKLGSLVSALLDSARIHHGKIELSLADVDLAEAAKGVVGGLEAGGICRCGQIKVIAPCPVVGKWDAVRIDEVLTNLCSNAVKYGLGAPVEVRIAAEGRMHRARIEVVDHGMGIDRALLQKIFDPFERANDEQQVQGLGLGLHIVRSIVEGHGGTISVESERGHGSRFIVELPRAPAM